MRVVDGSVEVDSSGKKTGRGAYLCRVKECWGVGLGSGQLERVLGVKLTQDNRDWLIKTADKMICQQGFEVGQSAY